MKKIILHLSSVLVLLSFINLKAQVTATLSIGTGSSTTTGLNWHPIYRSSATSTFDYSRAAYLYDATELAAAGMPANATITAIEWDKSSTGATASNTAAVVFNILMKNSAATGYTAATTWGVLTTGASTAYATTSQNIPATIGYLNFGLTSPFVYTGGALEILTDWDISALTGNPSTAGFSWNGGAVTGKVLGTSASTSLTGATSLGTQGSRPNIRIIYTYVPLPTDVGMQNITNPLASGCYGASENVIATIKNFGTNAQSNIPVTVVVSGAVSQTLNTTFVGPLAAGATATVNFGTLNMTTAGSYTFNGFTSQAGDGNILNDAMPSTTRTVIAPVALPQTVSFTGYTGANLTTVFPFWSEATGSLVTSGTTSSWTSQTGLNGAGNITARLNLYTTTRNEWIVGPKFTAAANAQLTFDAAVTDWNSTTVADVMGSDDKVRVMVSTDCGVSYTPVLTINATNSLTTSFTNFTVNLGAYAGQQIIVAFLGQDGPTADLQDYDFHLDNINIVSPVSNDVGATTMITPVTTGCYGATENVSIAITNYGLASQSNIPVTVVVSGAVSQTLNTTFSGPLASGASATVNLGTLNMTTAGTYSFAGFTSLAGDAVSANDPMPVVTLTAIAPVTLPISNPFTGFTGSNLPTVFAGWSEATGSLVPSGTTSLWTSQTGLNGASNITARINLYTTTRNEWILGPKFTATAGTKLTFDAAVTDWNSITAADVMGSDDKVRVMVSTDCGVSYTPVLTINATNSLTTSFTNFTVNLGAYAGQQIIVAFLGQDGPTDDPEDYDFHLDNINICNIPSAPSAPIAAAICSGTVATINSTTVTGTPYWYTVSTGGSVVSTSTVFTTPTLTANTTYYLADSTGCGISPRTAVTVTVNPIPTLTVASTSSAVCTGNAATLTVTGATTYSWSGVGSGSSIVVNPTVTSTYTVTGNSLGCGATSSITQSVNPLPSVNAVTSTSILCTGNTATLSATGATTYSWSGVGSGASIAVNPTVTTVYTVTGTDANGCVATIAITQTVSACTGIGELSKTASLMVYPNPATSDVTVFVSDLSNSTKVEVMDALGRVIISAELKATSTTISVSELANGMYSYRIVNENGLVGFGKLVKE